MKKVWKKACSLALTVAVLSSYSLTANALGEETKKYETEKYLIEKVSNPTSGEGEVDGILTGQDQAREQSYSWSMIEYGDSIYIGTCYNPIAGIYYRNVISNLTSKGMDAEKAAKIASKLIELMYDGAMYTEGISQTSPVIVKVNKESYDAEIVYKYTAGRNNMAGYRMAAEFNDKLYFVGSGYPTNNLVETDPDTLVNNKQGFAMFRGSKEEDGTWSWKMIIGDKNQGALYDFGLGVKESGAGNLFVYDNYLYIGNYNDPMLDLAEIPNNGNFELVYNDLVNAVNLYRMDENENIEMVVGQPNEEFVAGPIGNMGPGFDDKYNHGLRTFQATEEGLFLGTANPFYGTQLWLLKDKDSFVEDDNNENPGDENDTPGEDSEISNDSTLKDTVEDSNKDQVIVVENQNNKDKQHNKLPVTGGINSAFVIVVAVILMMFGFKIYSYNRKQ